MRIKRQKQTKKSLHLYTSLFEFRPPFQTLVDGNFINSVLKIGLKSVQETLVSIFNDNIKPMSTNCVLVELKKLKDQVHPDAAKVCRELEMRKCNHYPPQAPSDCIKGILGGENKHRYAIATNDKELRQEVAKIPGVPLVYINKSVVILEPPSVATLKRSKELELKKLIPKGSLLNVEKKVEPIRRFKKRPSAPNPLSVKKKKKPTEIERGNVMRDVEKLRQEMDSEPRKRQRKH